MATRRRSGQQTVKVSPMELPPLEVTRQVVTKFLKVLVIFGIFNLFFSGWMPITTPELFESKGSLGEAISDVWFLFI